MKCAPFAHSVEQGIEKVQRMIYSLFVVVGIIIDMRGFSEGILHRLTRCTTRDRDWLFLSSRFWIISDVNRERMALGPNIIIIVDRLGRKWHVVCIHSTRSKYDASRTERRATSGADFVLFFFRTDCFMGFENGMWVLLHWQNEYVHKYTRNISSLLPPNPRENPKKIQKQKGKTKKKGGNAIS